MEDGAPGEIRTPDRSVRSRLLYPAELRVRGHNLTASAHQVAAIIAKKCDMARVFTKISKFFHNWLIYRVYDGWLCFIGKMPDPFHRTNWPRPRRRLSFWPHSGLMLGLCGRAPGPGRAAPMRPALRSFVRVSPSRASPSELTASQGLIWASRRCPATAPLFHGAWCALSAWY